MSHAPGVLPRSRAVTRVVAPGVELTRLLDVPGDPAVSMDELWLDPGAATDVLSLAVDQRCLAGGSGAVWLGGVRHHLETDDLIVIPRGLSFRFENTGGARLRVWSVATPAWRGANHGEARPVPGEHDAPMRRGAEVVGCDPSAEFFISEGVFILERAGSDADPAVAVARARLPPGVTTVLHWLAVDERYFITAGTGVVEVAGQRAAVGPGDIVMIPRGVPQRITSAEESVEFYCITTPRFTPVDYSD